MSDPFLAEIRMFAGDFAPQGWAKCEGQVLAINQNHALFSLLGTTYGGDGKSTFALPDMRGRVPVHASTSAGAGADDVDEVRGGGSTSSGPGDPAARRTRQTVLTFIIALQGIFPSRP